jgi:hypothetical protein
MLGKLPVGQLIPRFRSEDEDFMDIRCVVTGQNPFGKSVVVRNAPVAPITVGPLPGVSPVVGERIGRSTPVEWDGAVTSWLLPAEERIPFWVFHYAARGRLRAFTRAIYLRMPRKVADS